MSQEIKKVVLAFSGGLDTSVILKWLQQTYGCEVVTFTADLGQGEELEPARAKAELLGVKQIFIEDLREEFVRDYVMPMMRANALYEGQYLLGTSIARPLIAKKQIEIARMVGADAVSHGATGKGNDQVRFELGYYALAPDIKIIAPWREWDLTSREALIAFAEAHQIPVAKDKRGESPFSTDANMLHTSSEGKVLEDPWEEVPDYVYSRTVNPEDAPDAPEYITVDFERGDGVALNGVAMSPATLLTALNELGRKHGIGRLDLVENRFVGMKSRGMYETPGGEIYARAHRGMHHGAPAVKDCAVELPVEIRVGQAAELVDQDDQPPRPQQPLHTDQVVDQLVARVAFDQRRAALAAELGAGCVQVVDELGQRHHHLGERRQIGTKALEQRSELRHHEVQQDAGDDDRHRDHGGRIGQRLLDLLLQRLGLFLVGGDLVEQGLQRAGALAGIDQVDEQIVEIARELGQRFGEGRTAFDGALDRQHHFAHRRIGVAAADDFQRLHQRHAGRHHRAHQGIRRQRHCAVWQSPVRL